MREESLHVPLIPMIIAESGELSVEPGMLAGKWDKIYLLDIDSIKTGNPSFWALDSLAGVFHVIYDASPRTVEDVIDCLVKGADEIVIDPTHMGVEDMDEVFQMTDGALYKYVGRLPPFKVKTAIWKPVVPSHERFFKDVPVYLYRGITYSGTVEGIIVPASEVLQ